MKTPMTTYMKCDLCHEPLLPPDVIVKYVFDNNPFASFATKGRLKAHPECIIKHHAMLQRIQEEWI